MNSDPPGSPRCDSQAVAVRRLEVSLADCGAFFAVVGLAHDRAQVAQEGGALQRPLHQDAAAIQRVHLAPCQVELAQPVERAGDRRLGNFELGRQTPHRMPAVAQVAGQEHAQAGAPKDRRRRAAPGQRRSHAGCRPSDRRKD